MGYGFYPCWRLSCFLCPPLLTTESCIFLTNSFCLVWFDVDPGRVDSGGNRRSANHSAGRTKPVIPDNDDSFSFGGGKEVGRLNLLFLSITS